MGMVSDDCLMVAAGGCMLLFGDHEGSGCRCWLALHGDCGTAQQLGSASSMNLGS